MGDFGTIEYSIESSNYKRIDSILSYLTELNVAEKENYELRYRILNVLYTELYSHLDDTDRSRCQQLLKIMNQEIAKRNKGVSKTYFNSIAEYFERGMRSYIEKELKQGDNHGRV